MQPGATRVFLDANVLYSRTLRDWFCLLSQESGLDGIALFWSEDVWAEVIYHLRKANPHHSDAQVGGWRRRLLEGFPDAMVTNYVIDPQFLAGDPCDAHVIAAAQKGAVDYMVTSNIKDFATHADILDFEIYDPDSFLCLIAERRPAATYATTKRQLKYWKMKAGAKELPKALSDARAPQFAGKVKTILQQIALRADY